MDRNFIEKRNNRTKYIRKCLTKKLMRKKKEQQIKTDNKKYKDLKNIRNKKRQQERKERCKGVFLSKMH